jgi:Phytanoyl-CoA dioxygenase (PhyH)
MLNVPLTNPTDSIPRFDVDADVDDMACALDQHGLIMIPGIVPPDACDSMRQEAYKLLSTSAPWITPLDYSVGRAIRVFRHGIDPAEQHWSIVSFCQAPLLYSLADRYLGRGNWFFDDIYVNEDVVGSAHKFQEWHFDSIPHLKLFLYLTDSDVERGALECVLGSHHRARRLARRDRILGRTPKTQPRITLDAHEAGTPMVAKAGTVVLFDSDLFHRAGTVAMDNRVVIRAIYTRRRIERSLLKRVRNRILRGAAQALRIT